MSKKDLLSRYKGISEEYNPVIGKVGESDLLKSSHASEVGEIRHYSKGIVLPKTATIEQRIQFIKDVEAAGSWAEYLVGVKISTQQADRVNDVIELAGWKLENYKKNNVVFFNHATWSAPIGNGENVLIGSSALTSDTRFHGQNQLSIDIAKLVLGDFLKATSVGFIPLDWFDLPLTPDNKDKYGAIYPGGWSQEIRVFTSQELYEYSWCGVPMNPGATKSLDDSFKKAIDMGVITSDAELLKMFPQATIIVQSHNSKSMENPTTQTTEGATDPVVKTGVEGSEKAGRKISAKNLNDLKAAHEALGRVITDAEGEEDSSDDGEGTKTEDGEKSVPLSKYNADMKMIHQALAGIKSALKSDGEVTPPAADPEKTTEDTGEKVYSFAEAFGKN